MLGNKWPLEAGFHRSGFPTPQTATPTRPAVMYLTERVILKIDSRVATTPGVTSRTAQCGVYVPCGLPRLILFPQDTLQHRPCDDLHPFALALINTSGQLIRLAPLHILEAHETARYSRQILAQQAKEYILDRGLCLDAGIVSVDHNLPNVVQILFCHEIYQS